MSESQLSPFLTRLGYVYVGVCPECGGTLVRHGDPIVDAITGRTFCTNYGQCELAPG